LLIYQVERLALFAVRLAVLLLLIGALVAGVSFIPAVRARVPAVSDVNATVLQWLGRVQERVRAYLPAPKPVAQTSPPAAPAAPTAPKAASTKPATAKPVVTQPLTITSTPGGATVRLNTRSVGTTPLTLKVAAGTYRVTVSKSGYVTAVRTVTVKQGAAASVVVILRAVRQ